MSPPTATAKSRKAAKKSPSSRKAKTRKKPDWFLGPIPEDILSPANFKTEPKAPEAPHIIPDHRLRFLVTNPALYEVANAVFPRKPRGSRGRPPHYPPYIYLIYLAGVSIFRNSRAAEAHLQDPGKWEIIRDGVRQVLGATEADALPHVGPKLHHWNDFFRDHMRPQVRALREASRNAWIPQAIASGFLSEERKRGSWLRPHRSQVINGDGTVVRSPSDQTEEVTTDERTGKARRHRVDHDAGLQVEGGDRLIYGKKIVAFSVRQEARCHSRFILNVDNARHRSPEEDPEREEEAATALRLTHEILDRTDGVIAVSFDTAWRGKHRAPLIRRGLVVYTEQHDGINPTPLAKYRYPKTKCTHDVYAAVGRSCERKITADGKTAYNPLPVRQFVARKDVNRWRFYHEVEIPCRNGGHTELIPLYETAEDRTLDPRTKRMKFNRTEHLRQVPPFTLLGGRLKGFRQDSESSNCTLDYSHRDNRLPAYGADGALLIYIGYAWMINSITLATSRQA